MEPPLFRSPVFRNVRYSYHFVHFQRVCLKDSRWLPEISFDFGCKSGRLIEDVYIPPYSVRGGKTKFDSWSVIVLVDDKEEKEQVRNELVQRAETIVPK